MVRRLGVVAVSAVLALSGCSEVQAGTGTDLHGTVFVTDASIRAIGDPCSGRRPYLDVRPGAALAVTDGNGRVLAEGALGEGEALNAHPALDHLARTLTHCALRFTIEDVAAADRYVLEFGDGHVRELTGPDPSLGHWAVDVVVPE